jgi:hypothetical protein
MSPKKKRDTEPATPPVPEGLDKPHSPMGPMLIILAPLVLMVLYGMLVD